MNYIVCQHLKIEIEIYNINKNLDIIDHTRMHSIIIINLQMINTMIAT